MLDYCRPMYTPYPDIYRNKIARFKYIESKIYCGAFIHLSPVVLNRGLDCGKTRHV